MKRKKSKLILFILIMVIIISIMGYLYYQTYVPKEEPKPLPDYTWQQVAAMAVWIFGVAAILHSLAPRIRIISEVK